MTTKLSTAFKRELEVNGEKYTLTVTPEGFKLVLKGRRKGVELTWASILGGEAALATALNATLNHTGLSTMPAGGRASPIKH
jgi:hypothetical protein